MNWNHIYHNWAEVSQQIKLTWGKFSDDELTRIAGQREQLSRLSQKKYGCTTVEV